MTDEEHAELRQRMVRSISDLGWFKNESDVDAALQLPLNKEELIALLAVSGINVSYAQDPKGPVGSRDFIVFTKPGGRVRRFNTAYAPVSMFDHPLGALIVMLHNHLTRPEWLDREFSIRR